MTKNDEQVKRDWCAIGDSSIEKAIQLLAAHGTAECRYLAHSVAALCNIDVRMMLSRDNSADVLVPRWLFWYAYRYYSNETLSKIAAMTENLCGVKFGANGIGQAINKMGALIESDPTWQRRWIVIKRIIKLRDTDDGKTTDSTIVIQVPKDLKETINIKIQEK